MCNYIDNKNYVDNFHCHLIKDNLDIVINSNVKYLINFDTKFRINGRTNYNKTL